MATKSAAYISGEIKKRLKAVVENDDNKNCADCSDERPQWISLLSVDKSEQKLGVLCCSKCALCHHFELGKKKCKLKCLEMGHEISIEDIEVLEGSGNLVVNKIFEATLEPDDFDKYFVAPTADMECRRRSRFIKHKYKRRLFFDDMLYHECILSLLQKNRRRCCSQLGPSSNEPVCYNLSCQRESLRGQLSYQESEDRFANGNSLRESQQSYATSTDEESFDLARDIPSFVHIYEGPENESTIPEDGLAEPCLVPTNVELEYEDIDKRMGPGGVLTYEELASESTTEELAPEDAAQEPTSYYASPRVPALEEYQGPDSGQKIEQRRQLPENKCLIEYSLSRDLDISQNCVGDSVLRIEVNRFEKRDLRSEIGTRAAFGPPQA